MIGGADIVIPAKNKPESLDSAVRCVRIYWPMSVFHNAHTSEVYLEYRDIPFGLIKEIFVYRTEQDKDQWDAGLGKVNSMIYMILSDVGITVVIDDPDSEEMKNIVCSIKGMSLPDDFVAW